MRVGYPTVVSAALAGVALLLAGCGGKETGPSTEATSHAPDVAPPVPAATAEPNLAVQDLSFAGTDTDRDGYVSSAEYAASSNRLFNAMDGDEDGTLGLAELDSARQAMRITGGPSSEKLIGRADNDGDEKLTLAEFIADVNARFAQADRDGDKRISPAEFVGGHPELPADAVAQSPPPPAAAPTAPPR